MAFLKEGTSLKYEIDIEKGAFINFSQVCKDCRKCYHQYFKIDVDKCYDENGKSVVTDPKELYENYSFSCKKCGLLNILDFDELCSKETVLFLRKYLKEKKNK